MKPRQVNGALWVGWVGWKTLEFIVGATFKVFFEILSLATRFVRSR